MLQDVLAPQIEQGFAKSATVLAFATAFRELFEADAADVEMSDEGIERLTWCLDICSAIASIIDWTWTCLAEAPWVALVLLAKQQRASSGNVLVMVAIAVEDSVWYKERLTCLIDNKGACDSHAAQVVLDCDLIDGRYDVVAHITIEQVIEFVDRIAVCRSEFTGPHRLRARH